MRGHVLPTDSEVARQKTLPKELAMSRSFIPSHRSGLLPLLFVLALAPATSAGAASGDPTLVPYEGPSFENCLLTRIETQLVRCDNLTGAGVSAPFWIPEQ